MSGNKKLFVFPIVLLLSMVMAFASSNASELYQEFSTYASEGDVASASETYSKLMEKVDKEISTAKKSIEKAYEKGNWELYREAVTDLRTLSGYGITKQQTDSLLAAVLNEDAGQAVADASWLYDNSRYYRPTLKLSFSSSSPGYNFSYSNSVSVKPGQTIQLPAQEDLNFNTNRLGQLAGWGLVPGNVDYLPGEEIAMPLTDMTLFAVWNNAVTFKDEVSGTDSTVSDVKEGDVVPVPAMEIQIGSSIFAGWYDPSTGEFIGTGEDEYTVRGNGASFIALYKSLEVSDPSTAPYSSIPSGVQVPLSFVIENTSNETVRDIRVEVSSGSDNVSVLGGAYTIPKLSAGGSVKISGARIVASGTVSGEDIPFAVTMTDRDGDVWTSSFSLKAK